MKHTQAWMRSRAPRAPARRRGFSLLEVCMAVVTLTVMLVSLTGSIVAGDRLQHVNRESAWAEAAARRVVETMRGVPFDTLFARYNDTAADDPAGLTSPGAHFAVDGLRALPGDADGFVGRIRFPVDDAAPAVLRENIANAALAMPADLNGDAVIDAADHAADYTLLPVQVEVQWTGKLGARSLVVETVLCAR